MAHSGFTIVCTFALLAIIPAMSVQYREFLDRTGLRASNVLTLVIAASSFLIWLLVSAFFPLIVTSPLEFPTAALAAVAGFLASLTVRDTTSRVLPALLFSVGWTVLVFSPIAIAVLFPMSIGIPPTAGPLDLGGALPVQVAVGAGGLVVLVAARRWPVPIRVHARPHAWLQLVCGLVTWAGWILGFVGLEGQLDAVITPRIILNSVIAPLCAVIGWLIAQRIVNANTNATGAVAGLLCGIVAVSAGSAYFEPLGAAVTGLIAGLVSSIFIYRQIRRTGRHTWFIVGAHLVAGGVGLVAVGLFGTSIGFIFDGQPTLVEVQFVSTAAVVAWAALVSLLLWVTVRRSSWAGIRDDRAPARAAEP